MTHRTTRRGGILARLLGALVAVALVAGVFVYLFMRGTLGVDDWVVRQITAIAQAYVVPTMAFEGFDYQAPRTVELTGVAFTAPDGTRVIDAGRLTITLAEIPRRGRPIVIARVAIQDGVLRLERDPEVDGVLFKGLVPFVKRSNIVEQERVEESVRLSNVLRLEEVRLQNFGFAYVASPEQAPMRIDGFDLDLDVVEATPADGGAVWHTIRGVVEKGRLLTMALNGRVNLDTATIEFVGSTVEGRIDGEAAALLPSEVQRFLTQHEAAGHMRIEVDGRLEAGAPDLSDLAAVATLDGVNFVVGQFRVEVDAGRIDGALRDGVAMIDPLAFDLYDGNIEVRSTWPLGGTSPRAWARWTIAGVQMEQMLRAGMGNQSNPSLAGVLAGTGSAAAATGDPRATLSGAGSLTVREGRLAIVPVFDELIDRMSLLTSGAAAPTQRLDVNFLIEPDLVRIASFDLDADVFALTGRGSVGFDGALDLIFNGGPLKRAGRSLGVIGDLISAVTERAVSYRVRGTVAEPTVTVQPLGIGGAPAR